LTGSNRRQAAFFNERNGVWWVDGWVAGSGWLASYGGSGNKAKFQKLLPENKACGRRRRKRKRRRRDRPPTPPIYTTFPPCSLPFSSPHMPMDTWSKA